MGLKVTSPNLLILPLPPSLNHAYITRKGTGQRIMTTEARKYVRDVHLIVKARVRKPYKKLSVVCYTFYYPDNRKRDNDNSLKILRDALKGGLYVDDCWQVVELEGMSGCIDRDNPRVEVNWVETMEDER